MWRGKGQEGKRDGVRGGRLRMERDFPRGQGGQEGGGGGGRRIKPCTRRLLRTSPLPRPHLTQHFAPQDHDINANDSLGYFSLPLSTLQPGRYKLAMTEPGTGQPMPLNDAWIKVELSWEDEGKVQGSASAPVPAAPLTKGQDNPLRAH